MQLSAKCEPPLNNDLIKRQVRAALVAKRRTWCDEVSAAQRVLAFSCTREHFLKTIKHGLIPYAPRDRQLLSHLHAQRCPIQDRQSQHRGS